MKHNLRLSPIDETGGLRDHIGRKQLVVPLPRSVDDPNWPPAEQELLWVRPAGDGKFYIDNIPFYANGLNFNDVVAARSDSAESPLLLQRLVTHGGHSTFRVIVRPDLDVDRHDAYHKLLAALSDLGCSFEEADSAFFAVDVPPSTNVNAIIDVLDLGREHNIWDFDEGRGDLSEAPEA